MSGLRSRLEALERQSGAGELESLRHRLQNVGAGRRRRAPRRQRMSDETLASRLGGRIVHDGVVLIHERLPVDALHGELALSESGLREALPYCGGLSGGDARDWVFMDTETTGLAGGTGTLVFLLGMARFRGGAIEVSQLFLTGFEGEEAMLEQARACLDGADTLVTFNGRSFDAPLLAARYRMSAASDPFAALRHVDLLHITRRTFAKSWPDCRLQTAERRLLGLERIGDLPGSQAPQAWFDWVRHGSDDALAAVCSHNRLDLLSLVALPVALHRSHADPASAGADVLACARQLRHEDVRGDAEQAVFDYLHRHRAHLDNRGLLELARLARRRRDWDLAVELWEELAGAGETRAVESLAKYYEHVVRDYERARRLTGRLLARAPHDPHHRRRDARLRARLGQCEC